MGVSVSHCLATEGSVLEVTSEEERGSGMLVVGVWENGRRGVWVVNEGLRRVVKGVLLGVRRTRVSRAEEVGRRSIRWMS